MRLALVVLASLLSACGPDLELPVRQVYDAGISSPGPVDAGAPVGPLEQCREICPVGSTVSLRYDGACVCAL
jgi:hypothetical protein